ncbi:TPA: hypothetical protein OXF37_006382 [Pseudomonas aeruginosa]|nr:hypothetical protein [Pseudomonas aeruginosa]HCW3382535.1 hypothetical protein [Pseudomonas aeruginosa]HCW3401469.1 hypothetical protein [Pseudomonas aeruginosa]HCW3418913.1 hypothetical protein [Pseudomonas aeruginosa]HCW3426083.1 hypothetical protein [Pseudomonas aeruginosa]
MAITAIRHGITLDELDAWGSVADLGSEILEGEVKAFGKMTAGAPTDPVSAAYFGTTWRGVSLLSRGDQGCSRAGGLELRGLGHSGAARQQMRKTGQEWANSETECAILVARMGRKRH